MFVVINFDAKGSYQQATEDSFIANVSQSSVSRCIHSVTNAINQKLLKRWIVLPMTAIERHHDACKKFSNAPQKFECVSIIAPKNHESSWKPLS